MALLPTGWIKMPGDNDETKRFAWSHVKSIFYNKAANILLKDKLDEMDKIIDEKIAKALMSNVQVNDQSKIPTSALAYAMQQSITKNGQDIAKLNSDFQYKELTNEFDLNKALGKYRTDSSAIIASLKNKPSEIRNSGEATIDWYPANERNTYGIQVMRWTFRTTHMIFTRNKTENTWAEWVQYVTKSDLDNKIQ